LSTSSSSFQIHLLFIHLLCRLFLERLNRKLKTQRPSWIQCSFNMTRTMLPPYNWFVWVGMITSLLVVELKKNSFFQGVCMYWNFSLKINVSLLICVFHILFNERKLKWNFLLLLFVFRVLPSMFNMIAICYTHRMSHPISPFCAHITLMKTRVIVIWPWKNNGFGV